MEIFLSIIGICIVIGLAVVGWLFTRPRSETPDQSLVILGQRLEALSQQVGQRLDSVTHQVAQQMEHARQASERSTSSVLQQVQSFTKGMTELQESVKAVQEHVKGVSSFQEIFRSPKLRGTWGEASLESALSQYFARDRYELQHYFKSGEAADAVLRLPNDLLLSIDSKFNWDNFEKMVHADDDIARAMHRKQFLSDVKKKVDEIATKYILPGEGTTDVALMYVPAETVYYEIINNVPDTDIPAYARSKKVILASPNTFYLTISAIMHWFKDVQFNRQTQDIMKRLARVVQDADKLGDDFRVLGKHLQNASSAYNDTDKRLGLLVERTQKVIEMGDEAANKLE